MKWPLFLQLVLMCGCGSAVSQLCPERSDPEYGPLLERWDAMTSSPSYVEVEGGQRLAIREMGDAAREQTLVFISGFLSDALAWRYVVGALGSEYRVMLIDPPGCGLSDAPAGDGADARGCCRYCPRSQARAVLEALRHRLARAPARRLIFVGHSLGGAIILRMWSDDQLRKEYGDVLGLARALVLFAPADVAIHKAQPEFRQVARLTSAEVKFARTLGLLDQFAADATRASVTDPARAPREEAQRWIEILSDPPRLEAARWMIRRAVPNNDWLPDWEKIDPITRGYRNVSVPTLIVWGARDETLPESMGHKLLNELPNARLRVLQKSKHFLATERPTLCAQLIRQLATDPRASTARVEWIDGTTGQRVPSLSPESLASER